MYYSRILNSIEKRNPRAFAIAEVTKSELEDDDLRFEQFLDREFDGVDGEHEANTVLHPPEGIAEIRSCRERGTRKRKFDDMVKNRQSMTACSLLYLLLLRIAY